MRTDKQRAFALIAVAGALTLLGVVTLEFAYSTGVDYAAAANARDDMRAHFVARSVMNLSRLVIKVQKDILDKNRRQLSQLGLPDVQIGDFMSMLETPFCGNKEEINNMAGMAGIDSTGMKGLGLPFGVCRVDSFTSDDGKMNINCANGTAANVNAIGNNLTAMVSPPAFDRLFEERDGDGQFTDRKMFVSAIIDYVDRDEAMWGGGGQGEQYGYESLPEPYRAKNNYIDSVDELQLVRGMDDKRWALFGSQFTIYGGCKVNVGATQSPIMMMSIISYSAKNPQDPVILNPLLLWQLAARVAQARSFGLAFDDLNQFASFVKDPDTALGIGTTTTPSGTAPKTPMGGMPAAGLPPVQGVELDAKKLGEIAKAGSRRTYRVVAAGQVGRVEKRIIGVFDSEMTNQNPRDPAYTKGSWVYWREE
jgi:Type II secretion system (T2SS), protein K